MGSCTCGNGKNLLITSEVVVPSGEEHYNDKNITDISQNITEKNPYVAKRRTTTNLIKFSFVNNNASLSSIIQNVNLEIMEKIGEHELDFKKERTKSIKNRRGELYKQLSIAKGNGIKNEDKNTLSKTPQISRAKTFLDKNQKENNNIEQSNEIETKNKNYAYTCSSNVISPEEESHLLTWLSNNVLFMDLNEKMIKGLITHINLYELNGETVIFNEGEIGNMFFIVKSGKVMLKGGHKKKTLMKGDTFGEIALVNPKAKKIYSAVSMSQVEIYGLSYEVYQKVLNDNNIKQTEDKKTYEKEILNYFLIKYLDKTVKENLFLLSRLFIFSENNQLILSNITSPKHEPSTSKKPFFLNPKNIIFPLTGELIETYHLPEIVKKVTKGNAAGLMYTIFKLNENSEFDIVVGGEKSICIAITESMLFECLGLNYQSDILLTFFLGIISTSKIISQLIPKENGQIYYEQLFKSFEVKEYKANEIIVPKCNYENKKFIIVLNGDVIDSKKNVTVLSKGDLYGDQLINSTQE